MVRLGHSRPMHSVPVPINVRCYSNSDIIVRRSEVTLRADSVAKRFWAPERRTLFPNQARKGNFDSKSGPSDSNIARFGDRTRYRRLLQHNRSITADIALEPNVGFRRTGNWLDHSWTAARAERNDYPSFTF
jgi:hypothetical protein